MKIYVDNIAVYSVSASTINTGLTLATGSHNLVVQAWDSTGAVYKNARTITVQ